MYMQINRKIHVEVTIKTNVLNKQELLKFLTNKFFLKRCSYVIIISREDIVNVACSPCKI